MSLNIKNEETCRLASEMARLTGETMTGAITVALANAWNARSTHAASRPGFKNCASSRIAAPSCWVRDLAAVEHGDVLYDERGLP